MWIHEKGSVTAKGETSDRRQSLLARRFFVGVKSTNRPEEVMRLASVLVTAPEIRALLAAVLIVDDGIDDYSSSFANAHPILHYRHTDEVDVGLGAGRNMLTAWASAIAAEQGTRQPLYLAMDDDFVIDDPAAFHQHLLLFGSLVDSGAAEVAGGGVINVQPERSSEARELVHDVWSANGSDETLPRLSHASRGGGVLGYVGMFGYQIASRVATVCSQTGQTKVPGFSQCVYGHRVVNFFTASLAWLRAHPWDDELKLQEHTAFFFDAWRANARIAYCPEVTVLHDRTPIVGRKPFGTKQSYNAVRFRAKEGLLARAHAKRNLTDFIYTSDPGCSIFAQLRDNLFVQPENGTGSTPPPALAVPHVAHRRTACRLIRARFGDSASSPVDVVHVVAHGGEVIGASDQCWPAADSVFDAQLPPVQSQLHARSAEVQQAQVRCGRALVASSSKRAARSLAKEASWCRLGLDGRPVVFVLAGTLSTSTEPAALVDGLRTHLGTHNKTSVLIVEGERDAGHGRWNAEELRQFLVSRFLPLSPAVWPVGADPTTFAHWSDWPALIDDAVASRPHEPRQALEPL
eukprot:CAMPEP_0170750070 /NCGR_PEP_ID=MMETSP0437-20130122/10729_1 /TAXON_ID=0 /ORGANISM="Sexangularia sp." /LENGTH=575 /DNA_ID=CAMNT_0011089029 /DNA_START=72 /DNA_END=1801 /DNA_ORIENTATION=+